MLFRSGLPAKYGGFETLAHHLVNHLNEKHDLTVYCSSKYFARKGDRLKNYNGAQLVYVPLNANGYQSIIYDFISIILKCDSSVAITECGLFCEMISSAFSPKLSWYLQYLLLSRYISSCIKITHRKFYNISLITYNCKLRLGIHPASEDMLL